MSTRRVKPLWTTAGECCVKLGEADFLKARMSCRHCISMVGMQQLIQESIENGKSIIVCPATTGDDEDGMPLDCNEPWNIHLCLEVANYSKKEKIEIHTKLNNIALAKDKSLIACPTCGVQCSRPSQVTRHAQCVVCTSEFCWDCRNEWTKGHECPSPERDVLRRLQAAGTESRTFLGMESRPPIIIASERACVNCHQIVHHTDRCKHVTCPQCETKFCYICLQKRGPGGWPCGAYSNLCKIEPIQTKLGDVELKPRGQQGGPFFIPMTEQPGLVRACSSCHGTTLGREYKCGSCSEQLWFCDRTCQQTHLREVHRHACGR